MKSRMEIAWVLIFLVSVPAEIWEIFTQPFTPTTIWLIAAAGGGIYCIIDNFNSLMRDCE